jgi:hypothetical protein
MLMPKSDDDASSRPVTAALVMSFFNVSVTTNRQHLNVNKHVASLIDADIVHRCSHIDILSYNWKTRIIDVSWTTTITPYQEYIQVKDRCIAPR